MTPTTDCCLATPRRNRMAKLRALWYRLLDWLMGKLSIDEFPDKFA